MRRAPPNCVGATLFGLLWVSLGRPKAWPKKQSLALWVLSASRKKRRKRSAPREAKHRLSVAAKSPQSNWLPFWPPHNWAGLVANSVAQFHNGTVAHQLSGSRKEKREKRKRLPSANGAPLARSISISISIGQKQAASNQVKELPASRTGCSPASRRFILGCIWRTLRRAVLLCERVGPIARSLACGRKAMRRQLICTSGAPAKPLRTLRAVCVSSSSARLAASE